MQYTTLGRTGMKVSVAGLGCGGNSRVGLGSGLSEAQSVALVREALDLGVNFLDTAAAYGTEGIVGKAIKGRRESVVVSTKSHVSRFDGAKPLSGADVVANLDASLKQLDTDYVDIFNLHGLLPNAYDRAMAEIVPALLREKEKGKLRHLGVTESGPRDPEHTMLLRAVEEPVWEVFMLAFHMMHQNARASLLPCTRTHGVGTLCMFAVRNIFSQRPVLERTLAELAADGRIPRETASTGSLDFLVHAGGAESITDAAYRFVRHEPGIDVVLFGTGNVAHLKANIASITRPPLPAADVQRLYETFRALVGVGLDLPDHVQAARAKQT
ncbi:MAG TPA: aldo/keto reductase [Hyphomicrobiaceae bacterium]|nr:aldo/keto reductase [Hyphomicrobiaceae bacterium]